MEANHGQLLEETYRLTLENNKMLRKMRRQAWFGRIIALLFYAAALGVPIWFYVTYMSDTVNRLLGAYDAMQAKGAEAQGQYQGFVDTLKQFQTRVTGGSATSSSAQ